MRGVGQQVSRYHMVSRMASVACGHRSSHSSMIRSAFVVCRPCYERDGVCGMSQQPSLIALLHDAVGTRRTLYVLRTGWCLWLSALPHTPVWGYRKVLPPAGGVIGTVLVKVTQCIMKNEWSPGTAAPRVGLPQCDSPTGQMRRVNRPRAVEESRFSMHN